MITGTASAASPGSATTRRVPRFKLTVPLDLTVLRAGVPDNISGHTLEIGEGGMGVVAASRLLIGEPVRVEFLVPHTSVPVKATAVVRYQSDRCFGLQFLRLPIEQQSMIRYWTRREGELLLGSDNERESTEESKPESSSRRLVSFLTVMAVLLAVFGWWHWQRGWSELEAEIPALAVSSIPPELRVPSDVMQRQLVHRFMPEYPEAARQAGTQGTVVLDTAIDASGAVTDVRVVSGPEALSQTAADAVRWWRYDPYVVNGKATPVQTTVAVDFRLGN
jgi:TonB family protein